jgi:hypothetical protein
MPDRLFRLGLIVEEELDEKQVKLTPREFHYPDVFVEEPTTAPAIRSLKIGAADPLKVFRRLSKELVPPLDLLYLLHTSRCDQPLGRYQSPPLDGPDLADFLNEFGEFLSTDGRHDLWLHSRRPDATLVWDRHDLIYAYGPLPRFAEILREFKLSVSPFQIPVPHSHHYHEDFDTEELGLLRYLEWTRTPLALDDRQI